MDLLGNDLYVTKPVGSLSSNHIEVLMNLYQPLLSKQALCLYFTLLAKSNQSQKYETHLTLCEKTQLRIEEMQLARQELEQFLLLRTLLSKSEKVNIYYYVMIAPKSFEQFLKHDLFSRLLLTKLGGDYIRKQINMQPGLEEMDEFEEITCIMKTDFLWTHEKESQLHDIMVDFVFDEHKDPYARYDFLSYCLEYDPTSFALPYKDLKPRELSFVNYCGQTYQLAHDVLFKHVSKSYNRSEGVLDFERLKLKCENEVRRLRGEPAMRTLVPEPPLAEPTQLNPSDYRQDPLKFVNSLKDNMKLAVSEIESFRRLQTEYKFSNEVFNVLLAYVWKKTENFNYKFMDKICADWSRSDINTLEKALQTIKEPVFVANAKTSKTSRTRPPRIVEEVPSFNENSSEDISIDYEELDQILQALERKKQTFG